MWRRSRKPIFVLALFVVLLAPNLGLLPFIYQRYSTVADRYAYTAMVAVAGGCAMMLARVKWNALWLVIALLPLLILVVRSRVQIERWSSNEALFGYTLSEIPHSTAAMKMFAAQEMMRDRPRQALDWLERAVAMNPRDYMLRNDLGMALLHYGMFDRAEQAFRQAIAINPTGAYAQLNMGTLFVAEKRYADAEAMFREALRLYPEYEPARGNLERVRALIASATAPATLPATTRQAPEFVPD
jgi:tetratricopeptide (TPR) repeat protein